MRHHSPNKHPPTRYFNPRTHEECDSSPPSHSLDDNNFNPRTHEECDLSGWGDLMALSDFNPRTHEECDSLADRHYIRNYDFNPRTHEECDVHPKCVCQFADLFQSTHSRGVRLAQSIHWSVCWRLFQSTHSRGVRHPARKPRHEAIIISIHALTRSATLGMAHTRTFKTISIHALTRSATQGPSAG